MALAVAWPSYGGGSTPVGVTHFEVLKDVSFNRTAAMESESAGSSGSAVLTFSALGQVIELELESNDRLLDDALGLALPEGTELYRGKITGNENSWVRVVLHQGLPSGLIWDGAEMLAIEAPGDSDVAVNAPVLFRLANVVALPGAMSCGAASSAAAGAVYESFLRELDVVAADAATLNLDISAIGDFLFANSTAGDPAVAIATRINNVDGIFSEQVGVQITLAETEIFTSAGSDPFTGTTSAATLNAELGVYRENTAVHRSQGATHLFTGRDLDGSTAGTAGSAQVCDETFGTGLTQANHGSATDSLIAAHEIGHNLGAPHDGEAGSACASVPTTFLMAPTINGNDQFSDCSLEQMQPVIDAAACIVPLSGNDVAIARISFVPILLLGDGVSIVFEIRNNGTSLANDVAVEVVLPANLSLTASATTSGSCTDGAGLVNCSLGSLPAGTTATVTVSGVAATVGVDAMDASVTADADDKAGNDATSVNVIVNTAIDLVVNVPPVMPLTVGQSGSVGVGVDNLSTVDATDVELVVTLDGGIRPDTASWSAGSCTITGQEVECQSSTIAGGANTTLTLGLTAVATGVQGYTVRMSANETDRDPSNNNPSGSVSVTDGNTGGGGGGGGGGGSLGGLMLGLMLWMLLLRVHAAVEPRRDGTAGDTALKRTQ